MSGKYTLWLNYDNDKKKYVIPVNPETVKIELEGKSTTAEIDKLGTILHKGKRGAMTISWSSFFPAKFGSSYCSCSKSKYKSPAKMHAWIIKLMEADNPAHFVISGGPFDLDIYVVISNYTAEEDGGDPGTIQYTIKMKEYRSVTVKKYKKKSSSKNTKSSTSKKRVSNKSSGTTYTVKSGDCLWNIAKKYYGSGSKYTKIYNANKDVIESTAKKYGHSSSNNGNLIFPGTKLTIPS